MKAVRGAGYVLDHLVCAFVLGHFVGFAGHSPREESPCADADTRMLSMYTSLPPALCPLLLSFLSLRHNFSM